MMQQSSSGLLGWKMPSLGVLGASFLLLVQVLGRVEGASTGVQSHFGDITYAGAMVHEPVQDVLYVTGQVGSNGCFLGLLNRRTMQWISRWELPEPAICQSLVFGKGQPSGSTASKTHVNSVLALAVTEEGGLLTDTRPTGTSKATEYGLVVPVSWNSPGTEAIMPHGLLLHEDVVQIPKAAVSDPFHPDFFYVVSVHSEDKNLAAEYRDQDLEEVPNLTAGGLHKYGSSFYMQVEQVRYDFNEKLQSGWNKPFGLTQETSIHSVHIAQMIWNEGALVVVGSTRGSGQAFGEAHAAAPDSMNGFITKLDPSSGHYWQQGGESAKHVQRYRHGDDKLVDTHIEGICTGSNDANALFIVGMYSTAATGENQTDTKDIPYVAKINAVSLETVWEEQFVFTKDAYALACGVDESNGKIYIAGIVQDGGTYGENTATLGQDDIFLIQGELSDGHANFVRQLGTQGNDRLAHGGSGLVVVDDGVVLYGDTSGDFMSTAMKKSEIFVVSVDGAGNMPPTTETDGGENSGGSVAVKEPGAAGGTDGPAPPPTDDEPTLPEPPSPTPTKKATRGTGNGVGMMLMLGFLVICLSIGYYVKSRKQERSTERALVFSYLQAFDVEDVDVRHSATGGWHGTYVGKLAQGEGGASPAVQSHSSIVKDSLFIDYDTTEATDTQFRVDEDEDSDFEDVERREETNKTSGNDPWGTDII